MRTFGIVLIVVAVLCIAIALGMDTSVSTSAGGRVHNIGLMREQENAILIGVGLFIGGALFVGLGGKRRSPEAGSKRCPFCAEFVRREAIKCRFCGSDLPVERRGNLDKKTNWIMERFF